VSLTSVTTATIAQLVHPLRRREPQWEKTERYRIAARRVGAETAGSSDGGRAG